MKLEEANKNIAFSQKASTQASDIAAQRSADSINSEIENTERESVKPLCLSEKPATELTMDEIKKMENKAYLKEDDMLHKFTSNKFFNTFIPDCANYISIIGNTLSAISNMVPMDKWIQDTFKRLGEIGTNIFLHVNGIVNALEQFRQKNVMSGVGYLIDNVIAVLVPQDKQFLAHGFATTGYIGGNSFNSLTGRNTFKDVKEHGQQVSSGLGRAFKMLMKKPIEGLMSSETGLLAFASAIFMGAGSSLWALTGNENLSASIRNFGGLLNDIEQIKPAHWLNKKYNYFFSGILVTLGTLADWCAKWFPKKKGVFVPLTFLFDGVGRYFLRLAQNSGELTKTSDKLDAPIFNINQLRKDYKAAKKAA